MKKTIAIIATLMLLILSGSIVAGCADDAQVASHNLSKAADNFEVDRRVVFFNGITDTYLLSIEGKCSIEDEGHQLEVTCKVGDGQFKKHFLGLSDNVSYFVEQTKEKQASAYRYRVTFKPSTIVPDVDARIGFDSNRKGGGS